MAIIQSIAFRKSRYFSKAWEFQASRVCASSSRALQLLIVMDRRATEMTMEKYPYYGMDSPIFEIAPEAH